ncbi:MAG: nuclear transport factor 2 family protein [Aquamicrobium sp.]|uniref:DUF4440 domain-containing protein n=1 Tax=Mesorhizobium sp. Pch-S TaxID=2082387 RepID=UPI0010C56175|nr:nuclear transport factor 2 family protein [Mesorhizobium sp. Pch-S]MBR2686231.1 nuclear transport factor 2 family protein [Aquamicrobium sp.]QAZ44155.1 hypothetical protein C1M53_15620 [Mesorhizobium sp. Pch-S]
MDQELIENCRRLDAAARNDPDELRSLYADDFLIHRLDSSGETLVVDKQAIISFFAEQRDKDTASQQKNTVEYLHASRSRDIGMVVGKRTMQVSGKPVELIFSQFWRHQKSGWQMIRESVYAQSR